MNNTTLDEKCPFYYSTSLIKKSFLQPMIANQQEQKNGLHCQIQTLMVASTLGNKVQEKNKDFFNKTSYSAMLEHLIFLYF